MRIAFGTDERTALTEEMVRALADAGHDVGVAAPASFRAAVARSGFPHLPFPDVAPAQLASV
jgi:hypothetical protein